MIEKDYVIQALSEAEQRKYETCHGCRDRKVGCRTPCKGWQYREEVKALKYEETRRAIAGHPESKIVKDIIKARTKERKAGWKRK